MDAVTQAIIDRTFNQKKTSVGSGSLTPQSAQPVDDITKSILARNFGGDKYVGGSALTPTIPTFTKHPSGGVGGFIGGLAHELIRAPLTTAVQVAQKVIPNPSSIPDVTSVSVPGFGNVNIPQTLMQKAGAALNTALTVLPFTGLPKDLSVGRAILPAANDAEKVLEAQKAADLLKASKTAGGGLTMDELLAGKTPSVNEAILNPSEATALKQKPLGELNKIVQDAPFTPPAASEEGAYLAEKGKALPSMTAEDKAILDYPDKSLPGETLDDYLKRVVPQAPEIPTGPPPTPIDPVRENLIKNLLKGVNPDKAKTEEDILNSLFDNGVPRGGEVTLPPAEPLNPSDQRIIEDLMGKKRVYQDLTEEEILSSSRALTKPGVSEVPNAVKTQIQERLADVTRYNNAISQAEELAKIKNPFPSGVVSAARKTVFFKDLIDSATYGGAFGAGSAMQKDNATLLDIASEAAKGAAIGAAFPVAGAALGVVGRNILDPIASKLGNWFENTEFYKKVIGQASEVLKKLDSTGGVGAKLAQSLENIRTFSEARTAIAMKQLEPVFKLDQQEGEAFALRAGGKSNTLNIPDSVWNSERVNEALSAWKEVSTKYAETAKGLGFKLRSILPNGEIVTKDFNPARNYFPEYIDKQKLMTKQGFDEAVAAMVRDKKLSPDKAETTLLSILSKEESPEDFAQIVNRSGRAQTKKDVEQFVNKYYKSGSPRRFSSLEYSRNANLPPELLIKDPRVVLTRYVQSASHRIAEAESFGVNNEKLYNLSGKKESGIISQIRNPYDKALALRIMSRVLGTEPLDAASAASAFEKLRGLNTFSLGLSAISNATQSVNTATVTALSDMKNALIDTFRSQGQDFADQSGAVLADTIRDISRGVTATSGSHPIQESFMRATGFPMTERLNRVIAANAGKHYLLNLEEELMSAKNYAEASPIVKAKFYELGLNPKDIWEKGGFVKPGNDLLQGLELGGQYSHKTSIYDPRLLYGAKKIVEKSQFRTSAQDLPLFWSSDFGKLITQFKTFQYKQMQFVKSQVFDELARGNAAPLIKYATIALALGEPSQNLKALIRGDSKRFDMTATQKMMDDLLAVGGLGLFSDAIKAASGGNYGTTRFLLGPTFSRAADVAGRIGTAGVGIAGGKPIGEATKPVQKFGVSMIPVLGPGIANIAYPARGTNPNDIPIVGSFLR